MRVEARQGALGRGRREVCWEQRQVSLPGLTGVVRACVQVAAGEGRTREGAPWDPRASSVRWGLFCVLLRRRRLRTGPGRTVCWALGS